MSNTSEGKSADMNNGLAGVIARSAPKPNAWPSMWYMTSVEDSMVDIKLHILERMASADVSCCSSSRTFSKTFGILLGIA